MAISPFAPNQDNEEPIKEVIPFNFDEVYAFTSKKFAEKGYDLEEGSNNMMLATAMSYLVSMLNANTAVNINETLLPLARKRKMVLQNARLLGYEIKHMISYRYRLTLDFGTEVVNINKYAKFEAGKTYYYMGEFLSNVTGVVTIEVLEGDLKKFEQDPKLEQYIQREFNTGTGRYKFDYYIDIPYTNVEDTGIDVFLTYSNENGDHFENELWKQADTFIIDRDIRPQKMYTRVDDIEQRTPRIFFGMFDSGDSLRENTIVRTNVLISSGSDGEIPEGTEMKALDFVCDITKVELINRGADEEDSASIKQNAPVFFNSANRLVTELDYKSFVNRDTRVKYSNMWSGADEEPRKPGNIWMSFVPQHTIRGLVSSDSRLWTLRDSSDSNWYLSDFIDDSLTKSDVEMIKDSMKPHSIPTLTYLHRQPIYFDFYYEISVARYTGSKTTEDWNKSVFNVIDSYFKGGNSIGVETFNYEYFQSSLIKRIDQELTDETGLNIKLKTIIPIHNKNIIREGSFIVPGCVLDGINESLDDYIDYKRQFRFHLGTPFEKYAESDPITGAVTVLPDNLPRINAEFNGKILYVDFNNPVVTKRTSTYPVMLLNTTTVCYDPVEVDLEVPCLFNVGSYRVFTDSSDSIEVILDFCDTLLETDFNVPVNIEVTYKTPNIKFKRNTIPRLREVNIIYS